MSDDDLIRRGDALECFMGYDRIGDIKDALAALPAVTPGVMVKPLAWEQEYGYAGRAETSIGVYSIECFPGQGQPYRLITAFDESSRHKTLEAAKAAAQADYEARILAALDLTPQPAPDVGMLVEAATSLLSAVDAYADTPPQSSAEALASCDVATAAEAVRDALATMEGKP